MYKKRRALSHEDQLTHPLTVSVSVLALFIAGFFAVNSLTPQAGQVATVVASSHTQEETSFDLVSGYSIPNGGHLKRAGEAVSLSHSIALNSVGFTLSKVGSPTGVVVARVFGVAGIPGATGRADARLLASSIARDASDISEHATEISFVFPDTPFLGVGDYFFAVEYISGDMENALRVHTVKEGFEDGNYAVSYNGETWFVGQERDALFSINGEKVDTSLTVHKPKEGAVWQKGEAYRIEWKGDFPGNIHITLSPQTCSSCKEILVASRVPTKEGYYRFTPEKGLASGKYVLTVESAAFPRLRAERNIIISENMYEALLPPITK